MDSTGEHSHIPIAGRVYRSIIGIVGAVTALALALASSIEDNVDDDDDDDDDNDDNDNDDCPLAFSRSTSFGDPCQLLVSTMPSRTWLDTSKAYG